jgi:uncharacterized protein (DUF927 family)
MVVRSGGHLEVLNSVPKGLAPIGTAYKGVITMSQTPSIITPHQAIEFGWSIIPTRNKLPMLTSWKPYQSRKPNTEEFETWLKLNPSSWAIITGAVSGRITLDFDGEAGRQTLEKLAIPPHRSTPSGGFHADFIHPGWHVPTLNSNHKLELSKNWPGMDVRGDGGYVLFYGDGYAWLRNPEPHPLTLLPGELQLFLGQTQRTPDEIIRKALDRIPSEGRNTAGFWLATQLRDNGFNHSQALAAMQAYRSMCPTVNRKGEEEEYLESEVIATLDQAYGRPSRKPWSSTKVNGGMHAAAAPAPIAEPPTTRRHFDVTANGVFYVDEETGSKIFVCSKLEVLAYARDANSEAWGRLLRWQDPCGNQHTWTVPMRLVVGDAVQVRETLADGGLDIGTSPKTNHLLSQYIRMEKPARFLHCVPHIGWFGKVFVFPERTIPEAADVTYQAPGRGEHFYRQAGTLEAWRKNVSERCRGNSRLVFGESAGFAPPLLQPLNIQSGGLHYGGGTSIGKTTLQAIVGSIWGGGGQNGFTRTWATTKNALESIAELHNDGCLILDEIRLIDPRDVEQVVYMLCSGSGKSRETKSMTGRRTLQWRLMILSSGEITPAQCAALAGQKMKGGAEIRIATIPADAGKGMGLFEQLHGTDDPRVFAESLEAAAKQNYGTAIVAFIEYLVANWDEEIASSAQWIEEFIKDNLPAGASSEHRRVLRRFAVIGCAGEIATEAGITGWEPGTATWAAQECFQAWLKEIGGIEPTDVRNAIRQVRSIVEKHHNRFYAVEPEKIKVRDEDGHFVEKIVRQNINNALGYWKTVENETVYLFNCEAFEDEACQGFDYKQIAAELYKRNLLLVTPTELGRGGYTHQCRVTDPAGQSQRSRFYAVRAKITE